MERLVQDVPQWYRTLDRLYPVTGPVSAAFIDRGQAGSDHHVFVHSALVAADAGLRSVDYARREYVDEARVRESAKGVREADILADLYRLIGEAIESSGSRMQPNDDSPPTLGEFASSVALYRLVTSFKSAHLLYSIGHCTDADAVSRVILEQVAWAYVVGTMTSIEDIEAVRPNACIGDLKVLYPEAGVLYGLLSGSAHLDVSGHRARFERKKERNLVTLVEPCLEHACLVLARLCDAYLAVWDTTQARHLTSLESVVREGNTTRLRDDRPFLGLAREQRQRARDFRASQTEAN